MMRSVSVKCGTKHLFGSSPEKNRCRLLQRRAGSGNVVNQENALVPNQGRVQKRKHFFDVLSALGGGREAGLRRFLTRR